MNYYRCVGTLFLPWFIQVYLKTFNSKTIFPSVLFNLDNFKINQILYCREVWRVGYFLTYNTKPLFKPFVSKISETALQNSFNLTSLKGVKYQLYTNNTSGFAYRWSYSLLFNQEVSVLDWVRIQNTIKNTWCQQHNKGKTLITLLSFSFFSKFKR